MLQLEQPFRAVDSIDVELSRLAQGLRAGRGDVTVEVLLWDRIDALLDRRLVHTRSVRATVTTRPGATSEPEAPAPG